MQNWKKTVYFPLFSVFMDLSTWSGGTLPLNNLLQPLGHAVHELLRVLQVVHLYDPEPLDLLDPMILWYLALFPDCFQGHLGLPQSNGHLLHLIWEAFGENFLYGIHVAWSFGKSRLSAISKYCCKKAKKTVPNVRLVWVHQYRV